MMARQTEARLLPGGDGLLPWEVNAASGDFRQATVKCSSICKIDFIIILIVYIMEGMSMKKFTKELGPGWITLVENDDYALSRLIFGDGLEVDCDEEETPLLKKGFQQIQEYWTGHRVIFTLPLAPGGSDFEREVWETVMHIPYGEHFTTPTLLAALSLEDTEENRARVIKAVDDCPIPIFIPTHRVGDPETEHDEEYHYPAGEDVKGAFMALEHPLD